MAEVASVIETPWNMSAGPDLAFPSTRGSCAAEFRDAGTDSEADCYANGGVGAEAVRRS
jgi:hypothetical protein